MILLTTSQHLAAQTAGASHRSSKQLTHGGRWRLAGVVWLSLVTGASADSLQTEIVEPDADAVLDGDASRESWYYGNKGLTYDPEGPANLWIGLGLQTRFDDYPGQNPSAADLLLERDSELDFNRGRLRGGGPLAADRLDKRLVSIYICLDGSGGCPSEQHRGQNTQADFLPPHVHSSKGALNRCSRSGPRVPIVCRRTRQAQKVTTWGSQAGTGRSRRAA